MLKNVVKIEMKSFNKQKSLLHNNNLDNKNLNSNGSNNESNSNNNIYNKIDRNKQTKKRKLKELRRYSKIITIDKMKSFINYIFFYYFISLGFYTYSLVIALMNIEQIILSAFILLLYGLELVEGIYFLIFMTSYITFKTKKKSNENENEIGEEINQNNNDSNSVLLERPFIVIKNLNRAQFFLWHFKFLINLVGTFSMDPDTVMYLTMVLLIFNLILCLIIKFLSLTLIRIEYLKQQLNLKV
jgi:hypothetical protein